MVASLFESIGKSGLALAVAGGAVHSALYNVDTGHKAVISDRFHGVQDAVVGEGTHFLILSSHAYRNQLSLTAVLGHVMCQPLVAKIYRTSTLHCTSSSRPLLASFRIFTSIEEN
ncbi:Prohibitin [Plecturocebus cupreus]